MATRARICPKCGGQFEVSQTEARPPRPVEVRCSTCDAVWPVLDADRTQPSGRPTYLIGAEARSVGR